MPGGRMRDEQWALPGLSAGRRAEEVTPFHPFCLAGGRWRHIRAAFWICGASVLGLPVMMLAPGIGDEDGPALGLLACMAAQLGIGFIGVPAMAAVRFAAARRLGHLDALVLTRLTPHQAGRLLERGATAGLWICVLLMVPLGLVSALLIGQLPSYLAFLVFLTVQAESASHQAAIVGAVGCGAGFSRVWPLAVLWLVALAVPGLGAGAFVPSSPRTAWAGLLLVLPAVVPALAGERSGVDVLDEVVARWPPDPAALRWWERPFAFVRMARCVGQVRSRLLALVRRRAALSVVQRRLDPAEINRAIMDIVGPEAAQKLLPDLWRDIESLAYEVSRGQLAMAELAAKQVSAALEERWQQFIG